MVLWDRMGGMKNWDWGWHGGKRLPCMLFFISFLKDDLVVALKCGVSRM